MTRVVALLACHNRKDRTITCLESLFAQDTEGIDVTAVLVDDGSTDGTADVVRSRFEHVEVLRGDGSLYWARSMAIAEKQAVTQRPEFVLWLNDDVSLYPSALRTLLATVDAGEERIIVGYTVDPGTRLPSYGGASRVDWHPLRYRLDVPTDGHATSSDTFNGNVVLVPQAIYLAVGGIDGHFAHAFADLDYGLRARARGFEVVVARIRRRRVPAEFRSAVARLVSLARGPVSADVGSEGRSDLVVGQISPAPRRQGLADLHRRDLCQSGGRPCPCADGCPRSPRGPGRRATVVACRR